MFLKIIRATSLGSLHSSQYVAKRTTILVCSHITQRAVPASASRQRNDSRQYHLNKFGDDFNNFQMAMREMTDDFKM